MQLELRRDDGGGFKAAGQDIDHRPDRFQIVHGAAIPFAAERNIGRLAFRSFLEKDVARYRLIAVASQSAAAGRQGIADLDHFDLAIVERVRPEEAAIREAEPDP